ncbi:MAG: selenocysteine-specific translation elongation factor [Clostridia bacterium]
MSYLIIGTAGHIDHGKTELVRALTHINTDRLPEEQARGISIKLGFAPLTLANGQRVGIIDVPGHERFIRQMLAGVSGMDLVLLLIAADEGMMPQTREHLAILDLLQVKNGIVVVTKKDLVDGDWLDLVMEEIKEELAGTFLSHAPMLAVSSLTGDGIDELKELIEKAVLDTQAKNNTGIARLPIDRVFSIQGFGTVVTGTLWSGTISVGDSLLLMPLNRRVRVRGLQVHGEKHTTTEAGQRVAVNITGIEVAEIASGSLLLALEQVEPSYRVDMELQLLQSANELAHNTKLRFYAGTKEILAKVILLDRDTLQPGESCFAQIQLAEPLVAIKGDRVILRSYSPMVTIGGGVLIDIKPTKHQRGDDEILEALATKLVGTPEEKLLEASIDGFYSATQLADKTHLSEQEITLALPNILSSTELLAFVIDKATYYTNNNWFQNLLAEMQLALTVYHKLYPLRYGMPREEFRSKFLAPYSLKFCNFLLALWQEQEIFSINEAIIAQKGYQPQIKGKAVTILKELEQAFLQELFMPPLWDELIEKLKIDSKQAEEFLRYFLQSNILIRVSEGLLFHTMAIEQAKGLAKKLAQANEGKLELAAMRDSIHSSRKFALPLLEYFDEIKFTRRIEDYRVVRG